MKLGFYKGAELPDPHKLLEGTGKVQRYVEMRAREPLPREQLVELIISADGARRQR